MFENYRSLSRVGLPDYEISLSGKIRVVSSGEVMHKISDMKNPNGSNLKLVDARGNSIPVVYFVAMAWYDRPRVEWENTRYSNAIINAKKYFSIPVEDKASTGHFDKCGNPYVITRSGVLWNTTTFNNTTGTELTTGYYGRYLTDGVNVLFHRMVAKAFVPVPYKLYRQGFTAETLDVNHIDGDKSNNKWYNLEWVTKQMNSEHASINHLLTTKITDFELELIFKMLQDGCTDIEIATVAKLPPVTINTIRARRCMRYNPSNYTWPRTSKEITMMRRDKNVADIVSDFNSGMDRRDICYRYKISNAYLTTLLIANRDKLTRYYRKNSKDLTEQQVRKICGLIMEGKNNREIADELGIVDRIVSRIRMKKSYPQWVNDYDFPASDFAARIEESKIKCAKVVKLEENKGLSLADMFRKYPDIGTRIMRKYYNENKAN